MSGRRAAFVDRDGVINQLVPDSTSGLPESPLRVRDVALIPGAAAALRTLADAGFILVGVSNQPAAAKGTVSVDQVEAVQSRVLELLEAAGARFDDFRVCLHHPEGIVDGLSGPCDCRKPAPGMLLAAARELAIDLPQSWMIGDTESDVLAGRAAGARTILIEHAGSGHKRLGDAKPDLRAASLETAALLVRQADRVDLD